MSRPQPKHSPLSVIAAIIAVASVGVGLSLSMPLLSMLFEQRGIPSVWIGANTAVAGLAALVIGPWVTPLAVKLGVTQVLVACLLIASASLMSLYFVPSFIGTFPIRLLFHAAITGIIILSEFWINVAAPSGRRGLFLGLYTTMLSLGFVAGPAILSVTGIEGIAPFASGAAVIALAAIPVLSAARYAPVLHEEPEGAWWKFIFLSPLAMGAVFVFGISESGLLALFPVYGIRIGFSAEAVTTFLIAMGLGNVLFQIPIGLLIDRSSKRGLTIVFALAGCLGAVVVPFVTAHQQLLYVVIFFWGGIIPGLYTLGLAQLGERHKGSDLAMANAAFIMVYSFGNLVGPPMIGQGMEIWNPHGAMWVIAAAFGVFFLFAISGVSRSKFIRHVKVRVQK